METIMTIGNTEEIQANRNLTISTVEIVSPASAGTAPSGDLVKVKIKYPPKWKKEKFFKDGDVKEVSHSVAESFIKTGIATLHEDNAAEETAEPEVKDAGQSNEDNSEKPEEENQNEAE